MGNWRKHSIFRVMAVISIAIQLVFPPLAMAQSGPQIVTDGRTQTTLDISGSVTNIRTNTISGNTGLNSFSIFNVYQNNTVNLFLPDRTDNLVNMVTDQQSVIDGFLNAYKDGQIGGNVYFLNPYGILVGAQGVINAGQLNLQTPSHDFMNSMFSSNNVISPPAMQQVLENGAPLSRTGVIDIRGQVNAVTSATMAGGDILISGSVKSGEQGRLAIDELVNLSQMSLPAEHSGIIALENVTPSVNLSAENNIEIAGLISVDGAENIDAGVIDILAGNQISALAGADVSADGQGQNSDGGQVIIMAEERSELSAGARISADAGSSGDGGFVEFSAREVVSLSGGQLSAAASNGEMGSVLIDPAAIEVNSDMLRDSSLSGGSSSSDNFSTISWNAGSLTLQATDNITVAQGVTISSRSVASPGSAAAHKTASSTGDSGDITLESQKIIVNDGATITAEATGSFAAGDVTFGADSTELAQIMIDNATIKGANITLDATSNQASISIYENPLSTARADIQITGGASLTATDNISISADSLQDRPGYSGGILVSFDAREARSSISISITSSSSSCPRADFSAQPLDGSDSETNEDSASCPRCLLGGLLSGLFCFCDAPAQLIAVCCKLPQLSDSLSGGAEASRLWVSTSNSSFPMNDTC